MFVAVWEFQVREAAQASFEALYGTNGAWAELFRSDPAYRGTELLRAGGSSSRYITIDRWDSAEAYRRFRQRETAAYAALDARGAALTASERLLGEFELVA